MTNGCHLPNKLPLAGGVSWSAFPWSKICQAPQMRDRPIIGSHGGVYIGEIFSSG